MVKGIQPEGPLRLARHGASVSLEVNLAQLEQPRDVYLADYLSYAENGGSCSFYFGKRSVAQGVLATVLEVVMPLAAIPPLLGTFKQPDGPPFDEVLAEFLVKTEGAAPTVPGPIDKLFQSSTTKEHHVVANFAIMGHADVDAAIAFYRLPPTASVAVARNHGDVSKIQVIPVVRVDCPARVLWWYCTALRELAKKVSGKTEVGP